MCTFCDRAKRGEFSLVRKIRCYKTAAVIIIVVVVVVVVLLLLLLLLLYLHSCVFWGKG